MAAQAQARFHNHGIGLSHFVHDGPRSGEMDASWLQYADSIQARDLTVEAAQAMGLSKALKGGGSSSRSVSFEKLKALLDSRSDRDIIDGLKRVISVGLLNLETQESSR